MALPGIRTATGGKATTNIVEFSGRTYPTSLLLGCGVGILIDRPLGSLHPEKNVVYGLNYGYLPGVRAMDGESLDAYVLNETEPCDRYWGWCVALVHRHDDCEDKMVVCAERTPPPLSAIVGALDRYERFFQYSVVLADAHRLPCIFTPRSDFAP